MSDVHFSPHPDVQLRRDAASNATATAASSAAAAPARVPTWALVALFVAALLAHLFFVTRNWHAGFLIGHEFRQSQTALITEYIDKQNNFSLRYDTPIFGKPWGAPLEFPLYEWCVVGVKRATHWPDFEAARAVSAAFFYATLPAVFMLLGQMGVPRARRLLSLALLLCCPVYIFYSRAFLIESTVLCLSVWWLALFVQTLQRRRLGWLVGAAIFGSLAGVVKSLTFGAWVAPAAAYGAWCLWSDWRARRGTAALLRTAAWGLGAVALPAVLTVWWTHFADSIKAENPATHFLLSSSLGIGNYGTLDLGARFSGEVWRALFHCWGFAIMPAWLLGACMALALVLAKRMRWAVATALAFFFVPQLAIPFAYGGQDYYFYAAAAFAVVGLGIAAHAILDSGLPGWLRWGWLLLPVAGMWGSYFRHTGYWDMQKVWSMGGAGVLDAIRATTPTDSVIIVSGTDWNATIPYYAKRRALMLRNGLENDSAQVEMLVQRLEGENIAALVVAHQVRSHPTLAAQVCAQVDLDPKPAFSSSWCDVYVSRSLHDSVLRTLRASPNRFHDVKAGDASLYADAPADQQLRTLTAVEADAEFPVVHPRPVQVKSRFGIGASGYKGEPVVMAHPESEMWVRPPLAASKVVCEFGIVDDAIHQPNGKTDGVEFIVFAVRDDGGRNVLFRRSLRPATHVGDRGLQRIELPYRARPDEQLIFSTRPLVTYAFDWAYWRKIEVR